MTRFFIPMVVMVFAVIISGCAPTASNDSSSAPVAETTVEAPANDQISQDTVVPNISESATAPAPIMVATSRGDKLVATDPATINLTSGGPTLVEFFRFT